MKKIFVLSLGIVILAIGACAEKPESSGVIEVDGTKLGYVIEGKGIPCVVIGSSTTNWPRRTFSQELRKHIMFIFIDCRAFLPPGIPVEVSKITMDSLVDDVERVRRRLGFDKIAVGSHSSPPLIALEYARQYPEHATHVIMIATPPYETRKLYKEQDEFWESDASDERKMILKRNHERLTEDTLSKVSPGKAFWLRYVADAPKCWYDPTYDCSWLFEDSDLNMDRINRLYNEIFPEYDFTRGDPITTPVFLAVGRYDYWLPYYLWDDYKEKLPNLSYNLFEKSGHFPQLEEQALFDKKLIAWIKGQK